MYLFDCLSTVATSCGVSNTLLNPGLTKEATTGMVLQASEAWHEGERERHNEPRQKGVGH